ncbi:hypothetical protein SAMN04489761_0843 [Tenacibaculum sp. MAR_2009_124]|uniref:hypothetical protein n=1 Tax=Tenacibaculum sp. MAR_2009_124 TaxID=1250059 RepID=UPI0008999CE2|nr:hypothetical protein [Tenacibaculum sp. MAR_2009_124]SEB45922.1 hypothetical protein SAMN04489761_0843 [Tenacibaculum sp. MAR_2009_124]
MSRFITIASAGNTEPPAYKLIIDKGYRIEKKKDSILAKKDNLVFSAYGALELLGLICLYETKGDNWRVDDDIIDEYCNLFNS